MQVYDKNKKLLKNNDIILVNTNRLLNKKAILKSTDFGFSVVYFDAIPNGRILFSIHRFNNVCKFVEVIDSKLIQEGLF